MCKCKVAKGKGRSFNNATFIYLYIYFFSEFGNTFLPNASYIDVFILGGADFLKFFWGWRSCIFGVVSFPRPTRCGDSIFVSIFAVWSAIRPHVEILPPDGDFSRDGRLVVRSDKEPRSFLINSKTSKTPQKNNM